MEDKTLIDKQYPGYGSVQPDRQQAHKLAARLHNHNQENYQQQHQYQPESNNKIELKDEHDAEDPVNFLSKIDNSIKEAKICVKQIIDNSTISQDFDTTSVNHNPTVENGIAMVKFSK